MGHSKTKIPEEKKLIWFLNDLLGGIPKKKIYRGKSKIYFYRGKTKSVLYYRK